MNKEALKEAVQDYVENMNSRNLVELYNRYCEGNNYYDDQIYENEEDFFETYFAGKIIDLVQQLGGNTSYRWRDNWVRFDGCGNLESANDRDLYEWFDVDDIVNHIVEEDDDLENTDIRDILNEYECEEDDEEEVDEE